VKRAWSDVERQNDVRMRGPSGGGLNSDSPERVVRREQQLADRDSTHSTLRERIVEHVFVGELLRELWRRGVTNVAVLRPEFDAHGYDLVLTREAIVRHVQFKTGKSKEPGDVSVSLGLGAVPSGCVLWIHIDEKLNLGPFYWFGGEPGEALPSMDGFKTPRRPTHNRKGERPERVNHRLVPKSRFREIDDVSGVLTKLFGDLGP
jgi:hypothetical protein